MIVVRKLYKMTQVYPKIESYGLTSQARRCAVSIPCNIAEGYGRRSTQDYIRFLNMSMGSLYELITLLEIAHSLNFVDNKSYKQITDLTTEVEKMLNTMIKKIQSSV